MRLIDADALTKKHGNWYVEEGTEEGFIGDLKHLIDLQPTIEPELSWIPCKKQLPVKEGDYFVTVDHRYVPPGYRSTDAITWRDGKWVMADYFVLDSEGRKEPNFKVVELAVPIIAWMPLPKEYQEDE